MKKKLLAFGALTALSAALIASPASAAPAAGTASWGYWQRENDVTVFPDATGTVGAVWSVSNADSYDIYASDDDDEYFVASTPVGKIFGATPATSSIAGQNYLKVETLVGTDSIVEIVFDSEVPAKRLGLIIGDVDFEEATISMKDGSDNELTPAQIKGTASTLAFNYCDYTPVAGSCSGDSDIAVLSEDNNRVIATGNESSSDGSAVWLRPSAAVKSIRIVFRNLDTDSTSTQRIWLAQLNTDKQPSATLADTGSDSSSVLWMASLGLLIAGAAARRFALKK